MREKNRDHKSAHNVAEVLIAISKEENSPVHLPLGKDAFKLLQSKLTSWPRP
jgi:hypothetical protein